MEKNLKDLLKEALQEFPDIKNGSIGINYNPEVYYAQISKNFFFFFPNTPDEKIEVDDRFLKLDKSTQVAILIHEIGHYQNGGYSDLAREGKEYLMKTKFKRFMSNLNRKQRYRNKLALEAYIQAEILADNYVARSRYGGEFLNLTISQSKGYKCKLAEYTLKRRIDRLKENFVD